MLMRLVLMRNDGRGVMQLTLDEVHGDDESLFVMMAIMRLT